MNVKRSGIILKADPSRVVLRPLTPFGNERQLRIIARVLALEETEVTDLLAGVYKDFANRHRGLREYFQMRFESIKSLLPTDAPVSEGRQLLIGAYFTHEYSLEAAALFNPSMVPHPEQAGVPSGSLRFILSLRATGEGHISSITFREGIVREDGSIELENLTGFVTAPAEIRHSIDKELFARKLSEVGIVSSAARTIVRALPDSFSVNHIAEEIGRLRRHPRHRTTDYDRIFSRILILAQSNYEARYTADIPLSERVLFPTAPLESNGMEDARFVCFVNETGQKQYVGTYTAYDGRRVIPQLIVTDDFLTFRISTLNGPEVQNKGMALFPRKINGQFVMISRQDAENLYIMSSEDIHFWYVRKPLLKPTFPWEFVQIGNCGSPIETERGWLVLSHGVGPMRRYTLGAFLLDLEDPSRVIARLKDPFMVPEVSEREGYVPNVLYACGGLLHNGLLILPYAMSDSACSFASVNVGDLLDSMQRV